MEQQQYWQRGRKAPRYLEQAAQLTEARAEYAWLRAGSQTVQQQALRDFAQAMQNFFAGTHRRPTWRKAGVHEGFRQVGLKPRHVERLNRRFGRVWVPKVGWVRFRLSRLEKTTTDLARRFDLIRVEQLNVRAMTRSARGTVEKPGAGVAQKRGLNRAISRSGWGLLVARLQHKAFGRVEQIPAPHTSQRCSACGHVAPGKRPKDQTAARGRAGGTAANNARV